MNEAERKNILEGVFLEMLGSQTQLALQSSKDGKSNIEYALNKAMTFWVVHSVPGLSKALSSMMSTFGRRCAKYRWLLSPASHTRNIIPKGTISP